MVAHFSLTKRFRVIRECYHYCSADINDQPGLQSLKGHAHMMTCTPLLCLLPYPFYCFPEHLTMDWADLFAVRPRICSVKQLDDCYTFSSGRSYCLKRSACFCGSALSTAFRRRILSSGHVYWTFCLHIIITRALFIKAKEIAFACSFSVLVRKHVVEKILGEWDSGNDDCNHGSFQSALFYLIHHSAPPLWNH